MAKTRGSGSSKKSGRTTRRTTRREATPSPEREATTSPTREATLPPSPPQEKQRKTRSRINVVYTRQKKRQKTAEEAEPAIPIESPSPSPQEQIHPRPRRTEGTEALPPEKLFFKHTEYGKSCKIASKCEDYKTIDVITKLKGGQERNWFRNHPQFQHLWHMDRSKYHKLMGMWMLLLRTVAMEKGKTCWFVVNGVPVRYSLKEHALISGLDCQRYPPNYQKLGSYRFVERHFGRAVNISVGEVKDMLEKMVGGEERLKMAVLMFLSTVIKGSKRYGFIDPFILRVVDNLEVCKTFPWGRYTFEDCMEGIFNMMNNFKGYAKATWCFPGFIIPLELLACESIPALRKKFREDVPTADRGCPRMCKQKWQKGYMKGFPLEDINEALGDETKTIVSVLEPEIHELDFLSRILEDDVNDEGDDQISMNWNMCLVDENQKIFWEKFFNLDKAGREVRRKQAQSRNIPSLEEVPNNQKVLKVLSKALKRIAALERRVTDLENGDVAAKNQSASGNNREGEEFHGLAYGGDVEAASATARAEAKKKGKAVVEEASSSEESSSKENANIGCSNAFGQLRDDVTISGSSAANSGMEYLYREYGVEVVEAAKAKVLATGKGVGLEKMAHDEDKEEEEDEGDEKEKEDEEEEEGEDEGDEKDEEGEEEDEGDEKDKEVEEMIPAEPAEADMDPSPAEPAEAEMDPSPAEPAEAEMDLSPAEADMHPSPPAKQGEEKEKEKEEDVQNHPPAPAEPVAPISPNLASPGQKHRPKVVINRKQTRAATRTKTKAATRIQTRAATRETLKPTRERVRSKFKKSPFV